MKRFIGLLCLVLAVGCTHKNDDGNLAVFHSFEKDDVKTWDPASAYDSVSLDLIPSVYETLYQYTYLSETYRLEPLLAASMPKFSKDRLTVTIPIKKGVHFQDDPCFKEGHGRELKAQDFVYAIKRLALPTLDSGGWWIADGKIAGINSFHDRLSKASKEDFQKIFNEEIEGVKALDDYTLQFKLAKQNPQFIYTLAMSFAAPVAKEAVDSYGDEHGSLLDHPVGTGPFVLKKWERNHEIVLDRNPRFRLELYPSTGDEVFRKKGLLADAGKKLPFLDRLHFEIIKESQPRWLHFMKGNMDWTPIPKDNFKQAMEDQFRLTQELRDKGVQLSIQNGIIIRYLTFNMKDKLLGSNKYLRQALSSAIDREKWITVFTSDTGKKMVNSIPPGFQDRPLVRKIKYDYNLSVAKELLKKAGYPEGQGLPPIRFDLRGASTTDRQLGELFAQEFAQIGVKAEVIPNTFPAFLEKLKQGNLQISFGGWAVDYPDAENIYQLFYGPNQPPGPDESSYDNPVYNQLYLQMSSLEPSSKRAALIEKMEEILQEDCPWALGYYEASYDLAQSWVGNFRSNDLILNKYKYYRKKK